jgi:hypothetical protein
MGFVEGWVVTHDGETIQSGFATDGQAMAWLHRAHPYSVDHAVRYEGFDIVLVQEGKVKWSYKRHIIGKERPEMGVFEWFRRRKEPPQPTPPPMRPFNPNVDYYAFLGVAPTSTDEEIRSAYRKLAAAYHPDRHPGPDQQAFAQRFAQISEAFTVLSQRRTEYDLARAAMPRRPAAAAPPPVMPPPTVPPTGLVTVAPPPMAPTMFSIFTTKPGEAPPAPSTFSSRPVAPAAPLRSMWEIMYGPPTAIQAAQPPGFFEPFGPPAPPPTAPPAQYYPGRPPAAMPMPFPTTPTAAAPAPSITLPTVQDMVDFLMVSWPLDFFWDMVRSSRGELSFRQSGVLVVERIAGFDSREGLEYELSDSLGLGPYIVAEYQRRGLPLTELWEDVFYPMFELVAQALVMLKPQDLPGRFFLNWSEDGVGIELYYTEEIGRRPWK